MITVQKLKVIVFFKAFILTSLLLATFFTHNYFSNIDNKLSRQERSSKGKVSNMESKINSFNAKTKDIGEALATWEYLTSDYESFAGLRISTAKNIIEGLNKKYNFKNIDINMSKPELLSGKFLRESIGVEFSVIKIRLKALSDVKIYHFIHELTDLFPGYLVFNSYSLKLERDLNQTFLSSLYSDSKISSVSADIELDWRALKELE